MGEQGEVWSVEYTGCGLVRVGRCQYLMAAVIAAWVCGIFGSHTKKTIRTGCLAGYGLRLALVGGSGCLGVLLRVPRPLRGLLLYLRRTPRQPDPCVARFFRLQQQLGDVFGICSRVPGTNCKYAPEGGWWGPQAQAALAVATEWACQPSR